MVDYRAEETETDRLIDEWHAQLPPMTEAERDQIIKRISKEIEALYDAERVQPAQPGATPQAA